MSNISKGLQFFIFLLEQVAAHKQTTADKILKQWDDLQLSDLIFDMYERYHSEALENAFQDIDTLIMERTQQTGISSKK